TAPNWKVPERYRMTGEPSRNRGGHHLVDTHPAPARGRLLDRLADRLDGRAMPEVRLPGTFRPALEEVAQVVDEARPVPHALADRPPARRVRVRGVLGADAAHPIEAGIVATVAVAELVEARVVEDESSPVAVDLDGEVARPSNRRARNLHHAKRARFKPQEGRRGLVHRYLS